MIDIKNDIEIIRKFSEIFMNSTLEVVRDTIKEVCLKKYKINKDSMDKYGTPFNFNLYSNTVKTNEHWNFCINPIKTINFILNYENNSDKKEDILERLDIYNLYHLVDDSIDKKIKPTLINNIYIDPYLNYTRKHCYYKRNDAFVYAYLSDIQNGSVVEQPKRRFTLQIDLNYIISTILDGITKYLSTEYDDMEKIIKSLNDSYEQYISEKSKYNITKDTKALEYALIKTLLIEYSITDLDSCVDTFSDELKHGIERILSARVKNNYNDTGEIYRLHEVISNQYLENPQFFIRDIKLHLKQLFYHNNDLKVSEGDQLHFNPGYDINNFVSINDRIVNRNIEEDIIDKEQKLKFTKGFKVDEPRYFRSVFLTYMQAFKISNISEKIEDNQSFKIDLFDNFIIKYGDSKKKKRPKRINSLNKIFDDAINLINCDVEKEYVLLLHNCFKDIDKDEMIFNDNYNKNLSILWDRKSASYRFNDNDIGKNLLVSSSIAMASIMLFCDMFKKYTLQSHKSYEYRYAKRYINIIGTEILRHYNLSVFINLYPDIFIEYTNFDLHKINDRFNDIKLDFMSSLYCSIFIDMRNKYGNLFKNSGVFAETYPLFIEFDNKNVITILNFNKYFDKFDNKFI